MHEGAVEEHDLRRAEGEGMITPATPINAPPRTLSKHERELAELDNIYTYHAPHSDQVRRYGHIREMAKLYAQAVLNSCPPSRERSLALTGIQQATHMANAAIAIHEPVPAPVPVTAEPESLVRERLIERIAQACHEGNRAYCRSLGDFSHDPWDEAPEWQKASARAGVQAILDNPLTTPRESHDSWMAQKLADGWVYGDTKDPVAKTHPCLLNYESLPESQRVKYVIFGTIVRALAHT